MVNNRLSKNQIIEIQGILDLAKDDLDFLIKNIEYQLNEFGVLPIDEDSSINLNLDFSTNSKELRDLLKEISEISNKLTKLIKRHDSKVDINIELGTDNFDLEPIKVESNGIKYYQSISVSEFLAELDLKAISKSEYHSTFVKAKSQSIVKKIHHAWSFSCPERAKQPIKKSTNDDFINLVSVVTGWDIELARKNVSNAFKHNKESCN
ncbi:hypothetical protein PE36_15939 [Moritella sp. PE36]|uniref:hypothetical protein n=1 Tax=Moritella sp. PE36 TaxID=58051 RepID=UPI000156847E|nr:hypothetical protein [Moritella sp. PE36]EDM68303.1 hypothetical protein PE36_15939 [Moritella sp. PE36]